MSRLSDKIKRDEGSAAMKIPVRSAYFLLFTAFALASLGLGSCSRLREGSLKLETNPILTGGIGWAVVKEAYVRLKEGPSDSTQDLDHLRRGSVVRLDTRDFGTSGDAAKPDQREVWYGIESEGSKGWVRETELDIYDSRSQAERAAAAYR
jgi:hypothetical protein